ncbi:uncharacterized protein LACBIDRAFT_302169 [Laccaria bicolor S238N-H82]|uniref:Predicted protein n=1 Tax=Laccaria bicolor (strain S238N-H82 / ATCC MYA-4686) TaxID=486041 RepID=B0DH83_LACBS|nr:uncharacterized protein LACBIDRAFT_302169 [Laccaria bicolor S238N-H82]EDR05971.1 predicted protein [Laccaria bicolor S238N-H82]|eukprot:XP_001883259.1 predicted protein [Laccaria bicolor S238N-H82]
MSIADSKGKCPQDLVAIFHASFHPTQGNVIDWSLKASDDLNLDHLEFSALPSGLHLVGQDVVYFTKDGQHGVCIFRRRKTTEQGHRGFRLSSLGILLAKSQRPRPWRHVQALKDLTTIIYSRLEESGVLDPTDSDWEPARTFFEERKLRRADLGGAGDWNGWSDELDGSPDPPDANPTLHLPHLLRILGPSSLTLYKHILGRRRVMIYTLPPVEPACILCHVAADMCFEYQAGEGSTSTTRLKGRNKEPVNVLGMVTLADLDKLRTESETGRGWVACTTDAIFIEKPSYYDLLIDLTTLTPHKATRPTFYASKPVSSQPGSSKSPTPRLSTVRFAWSDIKLWNEIERILKLDSDQASHHACCGPSASPDAPLKSKSITAWTDAWQVYEDVCIICAGLWIGSWRGNSTMSYSTADGPENWGSVRLEGDDDLSLHSTYVRSLGMGIEGRPVPAIGSSTLLPPTSTSKAAKRSSGISGKASSTVSGGSGKARQVSSSFGAGDDFALEGNGNQERRDGQLLTTLALLQTFHAHTAFQVSVLEMLLPKGVGSEADESTVYLSPKDILLFELGPLSGLDARYLEWLAAEYAGGVKVVIKRGWKDLLAIILGYG